MLSLRPPEIVRELDRFVAGQAQAKRAIAIAIRNRWRHQQAGDIHSADLTTFRYLVCGPRGCGRTHTIEHAAIAVAAPLVKVNFLELAAIGDPQRAIGQVVGDLVDAAFEMDSCGDLERAINEAEESGIILIDSVDRWQLQGEDAGGDLLETAQQALIGLAAGTSTETRHGRIRMPHILMFATGNALGSRAGDTPPDLQMLFPKRIELEQLDENDLLHILEHPERSPIRDYVALLKTEGLDVEFTRDGIEAIATEAVEQNRRIDDIGARRLSAIIEMVLDDLLYCDGDVQDQTVTIDAAYVAERTGGEREDEDLEDFIL